MDHSFHETTSPPLFRRFTRTVIQDNTNFQVISNWLQSAPAGGKLNVVLCANNGRAHRLS